MKQFSELNIKAPDIGFLGDKIKVSKILNKQITVQRFKIEPSKFNNGKCLCLQISIGNQQNIVFTGSATLIEMIHAVNEKDFPFTTTIVEENDRFIFT